MSPQVHFEIAPQLPSYSPPPAYATHNFDGMMTFAQKERMASLAETKLTFLVSQRKREPSLRHVLLHAGFLEKVLDSIDATTPEEIATEPMIEEPVKEVPAPAYEVQQSLSTIAEVDEMDIDEDEDEDDDEDMPPLQRTISHRPRSPVPSDDDDAEEDEDEEDSDEELPSPPPKYTTANDHPLFNLFEVREKARREELSNQYRIEHESQQNMFLHTLAVAA